MRIKLCVVFIATLPVSAVAVSRYPVRCCGQCRIPAWRCARGGCNLHARAGLRRHRHNHCQCQCDAGMRKSPPPTTIPTTASPLGLVAVTTKGAARVRKRINMRCLSAMYGIHYVTICSTMALYCHGDPGRIPAAVPSSVSIRTPMR